jgi:membrane AbrB-like protein
MSVLPIAAPNRHRLGIVLQTLLVGAAGGAVLGVPGFAAGWLSGAIIAVSVFALAGRPAHVPDVLWRAGFIVTGISLGASVTPEAVASIGRWPLSIAALALAMAAITVAVSLYLRLVHGWDKTVALFAAAPGAFSQMMILAADYGADLRPVALVQIFRIVVLAIVLPALLESMGLVAAALPAAATPAALDSAAELTLLIAVSSALGVLAHWVRFPGGMIFGSMAASALLHATGVVDAALPRWVAITAFIVLGSMIGSRFSGTGVVVLRQLGLAALGAFGVGTSVAFAFAVAVAALLNLSLPDVIIAYAPGAVDTMMILALALHGDSAFIAVHHLSRLLVVMLGMPLVARLFAERKPKTPPRGQPQPAAQPDD